MSSPPEYREHPPAPLLAPWVRCLWTSFRAEAPRRTSFHRVLPDGCMDLLFDFTGARRFHHAVAAAERASAPDWAGLALDFGYADQPHLVREFREFAGVSPTGWLREATGASVGFVQDAAPALR